MTNPTTYFQVGTRNILNTDWPIEHKLERDSARRWRVTWAICNGIAQGETVYRTRREALEAINEL